MRAIGTLYRTKEEEWTDQQGTIQTFLQTNFLSGNDAVKATCDKTTSLTTWQSLEGQELELEVTLSVTKAGAIRYRLSDPTPSSSRARSSASSSHPSAS